MMVIINIEELLKKNNKSKYWLCCQMNMTSRNINRIIRGETTAISFKYAGSPVLFFHIGEHKGTFNPLCPELLSIFQP